MLFDVYDKFTLINKRLRNSISPIDRKKKRKVILKYFEAYALQTLLNDLSVVDDIYYKNILQTIVDDLNQKLT